MPIVSTAFTMQMFCCFPGMEKWNRDNRNKVGFSFSLLLCSLSYNADEEDKGKSRHTAALPPEWMGTGAKQQQLTVPIAAD